MSPRPLNSGFHAPAPGRRVWLDFFRGVAVVLMIETHVCNTFLGVALRSEPLFAGVNFWNGLVAPSFLFVAGYLQGLSMARQQSQVTARKWLRLGGLLVLGYALHLPFQAWGAGHAELAWRVGTQIDILQCLGASLLCVLAIQRWAGRWAPVLLLLGFAGALGVADSAQAWRGLPLPLLAFLNGSTGSLFPLFPWAAFVFAGALAGLWATRWGSVAGPVRQSLLELALPVFVLGLKGWTAWPGVWSAVGAAFFFERLAWVLGLAWACKWLLGWAQPKWLLLAGRQSLLMYVTHLLLISWIAHAGVAELGWWPTGFLYLGVLLTSLWLALKWATWQDSRCQAHLPVPPPSTTATSPAAPAAARSAEPLSFNEILRQIIEKP